jgi:hypothetical protein
MLSRALLNSRIPSSSSSSPAPSPLSCRSCSLFSSSAFSSSVSLRSRASFRSNDSWPSSLSLTSPISSVPSLLPWRRLLFADRDLYARRLVAMVSEKSMSRALTPLARRKCSLASSAFRLLRSMSGLVSSSESELVRTVAVYRSLEMVYVLGEHRVHTGTVDAPSVKSGVS